MCCWIKRPTVGSIFTSWQPSLGSGIMFFVLFWGRLLNHIRSYYNPLNKETACSWWGHTSRPHCFESWISISLLRQHYPLDIVPFCPTVGAIFLPHRSLEHTGECSNSWRKENLFSIHFYLRYYFIYFKLCERNCLQYQLAFLFFMLG